jgi:transposase
MKLLAIDLGQRTLITATDDKMTFVSKGHHLKYLNECRAELEEINTRIAIRQIQKRQTDILEHDRDVLVNRTNKFFVDELNFILDDLDIPSYDYIVIEDIGQLENLYKDLNNVLRNVLWCAPLLAYTIVERCKLNNVEVIMVHPSGTSSTCPKCNNHNYTNRNKKTNTFKCVSCNHESLPDFVATINIYKKGEEYVKNSKR